MTIAFADFITTKRVQAKPPNADIRSRWTSRIVARGLDKLGGPGAETYLRDYGRGISVSKVIAFALHAEAENNPDMAASFWAAAYELETGAKPEIAGYSGGRSEAPTASPATAVPHALAALPPHLQPGCIVTMQPVDAASTREDYAVDPDYIGQPKRDGTRIVIIATKDAVSYQSRSTSMLTSPGKAFDQAFTTVAAKHGPFVLDGEKVFLDAGGGEHRTGSQAAQANTAMENPKAPVICVLAIFKALYAGRLDLTDDNEITRITAAERLVPHLVAALAAQGGSDSQRIDMVPTAWSRPQKQTLCESQLREGREGEVWIRAHTIYVGGKAGGEAMVRTKYLHETTVLVTGLTKSDVPGRPFGAITVSDVHADGSVTLAGNVGTGYDKKMAIEITRRFASQKSLFINVRHQGRTENGILWHARFIDFADAPSSA